MKSSPYCFVLQVLLFEGLLYHSIEPVGATRSSLAFISCRPVTSASHSRVCWVCAEHCCCASIFSSPTAMPWPSNTFHSWTDLFWCQEGRVEQRVRHGLCDPPFCPPVEQSTVKMMDDKVTHVPKGNKTAISGGWSLEGNQRTICGG